MAVIGKIRSYSIGLVVVIAIALVLFLLMEIIPNLRLLGANSANSLGSINGTLVDYKEFETEVKKTENQYLLQKGPEGSLTDEEKHYIRNQVWNKKQADIVLGEAYKKAGVQVGADELQELVMGQNADENIKTAGAFKNAAGQFDPQLVLMYIQNLGKDDPGTPPGSKRAQWKSFEDAIVENRIRTKYTNLLTKSLTYVPKWQAKVEVINQNETRDFSYVQIPYTVIKDADVKPSDSDLESFLKDNSARFTQDKETRKVRYAFFDINPSEQDAATSFAKVQENAEKFRTAENDSIFLRAYAERGFDPSYYKKSEVASAIADTLFRIPTGAMVGPFVENGAYNVVKLLDRKSVADSVRVKILSLTPTSQEDVAKKYALLDSLYKLVDSLHVDFSSLVMQYSSNQNTKATGGDIGWIYKAQNAWNPEIFNKGANGKVFKNATQSELQLVYITEYKAGDIAVKYGKISVPLQASSETERGIYAQANEFAGKYKSVADLKEALKKTPMQNVREVEALNADDYTLSGLQNSGREAIKWAFNAKVGAISPVFNIGNKYVVVGLESIKGKGLPDLASVRTEVEALYLTKAKADKIKEALGESTTLESAAKKYNVAQNTAVATFNSGNVNGLSDPALIGEAMGLKENETSKPVQGNSGVFVVKTTKINTQKIDNNFDLAPYKAALETRAKFKQGILESIISGANIEDKRVNIY